MQRRRQPVGPTLGEHPTELPQQRDLSDPDLPAALLAGLKRGDEPQAFGAWAAGLLPDDGRIAAAAERVLERYKRDAVSTNLTLAGIPVGARSGAARAVGRAGARASANVGSGACGGRWRPTRRAPE